MVARNHPTLSLNMIVGPGEAQELERCLASFRAEKTFDEIVLVVTSGDEAVRAIAERYTTKVYYFPWVSDDYPYGNFGGARNLALENTTADWVWWLDADDVCMPQYQEYLPNVKAGILSPDRQCGELFFAKYVIRSSADGEEQVGFMRERIFRRIPKFRWRGAVHEQITPPHGQSIQGTIGGNFAITHMPAKPSYCSAARNLKILEDEVVRKQSKDENLRYFYARDLLLGGRAKEGIERLEELIDEQDGPPDQLFSMCLDLIFLFAYGRQESLPLLSQITPEKTDVIERWCRQALSYSCAYAEPFVVLGDVYFIKGNIGGAEKMWRQALTKRVGDRIVQYATYYSCVPSQRLAALTQGRGDLEEALYFNRNTLKGWKDMGFVYQRRDILKGLCSVFRDQWGGQTNVRPDN